MQSRVTLQQRFSVVSCSQQFHNLEALFAIHLVLQARILIRRGKVLLRLLSCANALNPRQ